MKITVELPESTLAVTMTYVWRDTADRIPTADVAPVRHGRWDREKIAFYRKCSECGAVIRDNLSEVFLDCDIRDLNYCPNCGANMDQSE